MTVIGYDKLETFWKKHTRAKAPLLRWYRLAMVADWRSLSDVRRVFASADQVCDCTVFNIHGNHYRLISKIYFARQIVDVFSVLTHPEYDKGNWKNDCC
jgi:mRNA interferase HigB